jgi:hypothetical protein
MSCSASAEPSQSISAIALSRTPMAERCPRCFADLPQDAVWVCPTCGYTLRTPAASKAGLFFIFLGFALSVAYVLGPDAIGLTSGVIPTDLAKFLVANFTALTAAAFAFGFLLVLLGAAVLRNARRLLPPVLT